MQRVGTMKTELARLIQYLLRLNKMHGQLHLQDVTSREQTLIRKLYLVSKNHHTNTYQRNMMLGKRATPFPLLRI